MPKRPALTEDSFLKHLFAPKSNPLPTGIRKRPIKVTPGRTKARVNSYNRMSPASQELLKRSGLRDAYLKGEATLTNARSTLRDKAVRKGLVKPTKAQQARQRKSVGTPSALDAKVASHIVHELRQANYTVSTDLVYKHVPFMSEEDKRKAATWKAGQIRAYAGDDDNMVEVGGERFNPLWYHYS